MALRGCQKSARAARSTVSSASSITTRNCGSSTVSHIASRRRSSRVAALCRIACSSRPWISVPHAMPASARCAGVSAVTTCVGSSRHASIGRVILAMCRASAVTDVIDQVAARAGRAPIRAGLPRRRATAAEIRRLATAGTATIVGTGSSGTPARNWSIEPHGRPLPRLRPAADDEQFARSGGRDIAEPNFLGVEIGRFLGDHRLPVGRLREHRTALLSPSILNQPRAAVRVALNALRT